LGWASLVTSAPTIAAVIITGCMSIDPFFLFDFQGVRRWSLNTHQPNKNPSTSVGARAADVWLGGPLGHRFQKIGGLSKRETKRILQKHALKSERKILP